MGEAQKNISFEFLMGEAQKNIRFDRRSPRLEEGREVARGGGGGRRRAGGALRRGRGRERGLRRPRASARPRRRLPRGRVPRRAQILASQFPWEKIKFPGNRGEFAGNIFRGKL